MLNEHVERVLRRRHTEAGFRSRRIAAMAADVSDHSLRSINRAHPSAREPRMFADVRRNQCQEIT